jgi:hypothetical protein
VLGHKALALWANAASQRKPAIYRNNRSRHKNSKIDPPPEQRPPDLIGAAQALQRRFPHKGFGLGMPICSDQRGDDESFPLRACRKIA